MIRPEVTEAASSPSMRGKSRRPELVAEAPLTTWRNSGRKLMAPNIATPMMNPVALDTENVRSENRCTGTTGSIPLPSTPQRLGRSPTVRTMLDLHVGEHHPYPLPPQVRMTQNEVTTHPTS